MRTIIITYTYYPTPPRIGAMFRHFYQDHSKYSPHKLQTVTRVVGAASARSLAMDSAIRPLSQVLSIGYNNKPTDQTCQTMQCPLKNLFSLRKFCQIL